MSNNKLTSEFLLELFKSAINKKPILEAVVKHLNYEYIPVEFSNFKKILKSIKEIYRETEKLPSIGVIAQQYNTDEEVLATIDKIREAEISDPEMLLTQLEEYIKSVRFQILSDKIYDLYNEGRKEEAIELSAKESTEIAQFSIRNDSGHYLRLFHDFSAQQALRRLKQDVESKEKVPFGIDFLDELTYGGIDKTETALMVARSGIGKSTSLKWTGFHAARLGYKVLHIQLEGSKEEAFDKYVQVWTALEYKIVNNGELPSDKLERFEKDAKMFINKGKEIDIYAFEKFDEVTMSDIRNIVLDYKSKHGTVPDLVIIDSLDLVHPGDGVKYGYDTQSVKAKLQNSAKRMKNLCVELKTRILTATQTGDVPPTIWNDPDKVITRNNIEGDRTLIKSFSYVLTLNQTEDELRLREMRIYLDKLRNYSTGDKIYKICTAFDKGRFYDKQRTLKKYFKVNDKG